ncbi:hypothetical protein FE257_010127 [Aspergillus nanangensis]|uniref:Invertebrate defensins family profile domain-containing protein n=1 Tax=Aspergillus nanangensis TaxID=2582783 RepID=A0AAD4GRL3_ASPNN|nr:hypothetical protein FE257_010127 [Aspergillus nanangensis]
MALFLPLFLLASTLASLVGSIPIQNDVMITSTSCQVEGGDDIANLVCTNTCKGQGPSWTGGYCDQEQICHCTF